MWDEPVTWVAAAVVTAVLVIGGFPVHEVFQGTGMSIRCWGWDLRWPMEGSPRREGTTKDAKAGGASVTLPFSNLAAQCRGPDGGDQGTGLRQFLGHEVRADPRHQGPILDMGDAGEGLRGVSSRRAGSNWGEGTLFEQGPGSAGGAGIVGRRDAAKFFFARGWAKGGRCKYPATATTTPRSGMSGGRGGAGFPWGDEWGRRPGGTGNFGR